MKLQSHRIELPLKDPFTIARGTMRHQQSLIVALSRGEVTGYGEVTCNEYYGHTYESLEASLQRIEGLLAGCDAVHPSDLFGRCQVVIPDDTFALSAVDAAAYDLYGKLNGVRTTETLGLSEPAEIYSSYTLGIDSIDQMVRKYRDQPDWPIYKIKLGTPHDLEIVRALRRETEAVIRVDANCAWTPEQTIANSLALAELGVEFIEQPLPAEAPRAAQLEVFEHSRLPIIADESCRTEEDVQKCQGLFHGINIKLCKCGGLTPGSRMLRQARQLGMKTMVGCMIESTVGISAAAQLLPLLDYADLDGATLLAEDAADGVRIENGRVIFSSVPGSGVELLVRSPR
ncbi:L-Ala-D/L-Glu epimerase [Rosistilla ulvae]|uniref:Dipeptide epimerase n=1 Tax=Rosistilla ulvae TaxID=1930277 RepID=A0A517M606_9BACT|nr:dipeptide epimerase [Rosistilla ulvae]QDS90304.1 L-Ala-D/L-Glu epimerase [Rosistilla ulvae]